MLVSVRVVFFPDTVMVESIWKEACIEILWKRVQKYRHGDCRKNEKVRKHMHVSTHIVLKHTGKETHRG